MNLDVNLELSLDSGDWTALIGSLGGVKQLKDVRFRKWKSRVVIISVGYSGQNSTSTYASLYLSLSGDSCQSSLSSNRQV